MSYRIQITNYRAIQAIDFSPHGVCLIVGPNSVGKTILLSAIEFMRNTFERGFGTALTFSGGSWGFANFNLPQDSQTILAIEKDNLRWELQPTTLSSGAIYPIPEIMKEGKKILFEIKAGDGEFKYLKKPYPTDQRIMGLKRIYDSAVANKFENFVESLRHYTHFHNYHLWTLRKDGSKDDSTLEMQYGGQNAFSVLRAWHSSRPYRERYDFVVEVLREAFPAIFDDVDFDSAGQTVIARMYSPRQKDPFPPYVWSNGILTAMLHLMAVCSVPDGGILSIDEPENGLHPYAIRVVLNALRERAASHDLTILLATHSGFILNEFKQAVEQVYVMDAKNEKQLLRLDQLRDSEWLSYFALGDLYGYEFARQGD